MRYLLLVYQSEKEIEALGPEEYQELVDGALDNDDALRRGGSYLASGALQPVSTATTLRLRNGRVVATDGPFAETKEQLGGFLLIEAKDLDEAIRLASKFPPLRIGCIEVRPVQELERSGRRKPPVTP